LIIIGLEVACYTVVAKNVEEKLGEALGLTGNLLDNLKENVSFVIV